MIYTFNQVDDFLSLFNNADLISKKGKKHKYYNLIVSFDIETSSLYVDEEGKTTDNTDLYKISNMYIWQLAIDDNVIYGRYWIEFIELMDRITEKLNSSESNRLLVYVHNLSYEFQYIRKLFEWIEVFAVDDRKPIFALTNKGLEFRCSYILSGYNLETLAKNLHNKKYNKLVGDLDYSLIRHNETELTNEELNYCFNDVLIVTQYIKEQIEIYNSIIEIPLTQTGKVRKFVKERFFENQKNKYFYQNCYLDTIEFKDLQRAFSGGFTHSNAINTNVVIENVSSYDFTSSYPYVMLSEKFPMGKGKRIEITSKEQFNKIIKNYCCLMTVRYYGLKPKTYNENILSQNKCYNIKNGLINNGRVVSADSLETTFTEQDFLSVEDFYTYEGLEIGDVWVYIKEYLPLEIIDCVLELYEKKTKLKGVEGKEKEYLNSKEMLNSIYGMCVTNTMKERILYINNEWVKDDDFNLNKSIENYNNDKQRFLFYPWGVWITAYARRNLLKGVLEMGRDYIYADTDSLKIKKGEKHKQYFNDYNNEVVTKLKNMCNHYKIDFSRCKPKTIKGEEKIIGVWDFEGVYDRFKTLGAKRYMIEKNGKLEITISGLSKNAVKYISNQKKSFDFFRDYMYIPDDETGKNTHTYIDDESIVYITDYKGQEKKVLCKSGVHLSPCDFTMSLSHAYIDYLLNLENIVEV